MNRRELEGGGGRSFLFQNIAFSFCAGSRAVCRRQKKKKNFIWTIETESNLIEWLTVKWVYFVTPGCRLWVNAEKRERFRCVFIDCWMWMQQRGCNLSTRRTFPLPRRWTAKHCFFQTPLLFIYYLFTSKHDKEVNLLLMCCWSECIQVNMFVSFF